MRAYACAYRCVALMPTASYLICCEEGVEVSWGRRLSWCELKCLRAGVAEGKKVDVTSAGSTHRRRRRQVGAGSRVWCSYVWPLPVWCSYVWPVVATPHYECGALMCGHYQWPSLVSSGLAE